MQQVAGQGGVFHLWGHSWELDGQAGWSELEQVLRLMADLKEITQPATNAEVCEQLTAAASA